MWFAPKIATGDRRADAARSFAAPSAAPRGSSPASSTETVFFLLLSPIMWFGHTLFLAGLVRPGDRLDRPGARRSHRAVGDAAQAAVAAHRCSAGVCILILAVTVPAAIPYALFIAGGPALSIPLAVFTARPRVGRALRASASAGCRRKPRRRSRWPRWRCPRSSGRRARGLDMLDNASHRTRGRCDRWASIMAARAATRRDGPRSTRNS